MKTMIQPPKVFNIHAKNGPFPRGETPISEEMPLHRSTPAAKYIRKMPTL
jgi:hypothetical protein